MKPKVPPPTTPHEELKEAILLETKEFEQAYRWLEEHMPPRFFGAIDSQTKILIARNLLSFHQQGGFIPIPFKPKTIVLYKDAPDADLKFFKKFNNYVIR